MADIKETSWDINEVARRILNEEARTPGDERRRSLVLAAYQLIAEGGFERLRTRDVAARAGVNIATLHYYFARKEDLIRNVVEYLLQQCMIAYLPGSPFEMKTPLEQIRGELAEQQYLFKEKPEMFIVLNELTLRSLHDPTIRSMIAWLDQGWHSYLAQTLRAGKEQGMFRADLDPDDAATRLIQLFKGINLHYMLHPEAADFERIWLDMERWLVG